jgi:hypothetical protein
MATPLVRAVLQKRGIEPIEREHGCRFFSEELLFGNREEVEVTTGEGSS